VTGRELSRLPDLFLSPPRSRLPAEFQRPRQETPSAPALHQKLLEALAPPSILVDESRTMLHLSETAGRFLQPPGGQPSLDVTELVRPELRADLQTALYRTFERNESRLSPFVPVQFNGTPRRVAVLVQPRPGEAEDERLALVLFLEGGEATPDVLPAGGEAPPEALGQLQEELHQTQTQMGAMREQYEAAHEELLAANEELQSLNEELETVNTELEHRLTELSRTHSDRRTSWMPPRSERSSSTSTWGSTASPRAWPICSASP
jgi:two-component system CheB/CheR fusion protein